LQYTVEYNMSKYLHTKQRKLKTTSSEGNIYTTLLKKESSESGNSTSKVLHESSSEIVDFYSNRQSDSFDNTLLDAEIYSNKKSKVSLDKKFTIYSQEKHGVHKLFSGFCRDYIEDISPLIQEKLHLDSTISELETTHSSLGHVTGNKEELLQKLQ
jgi:hypothetical protein